MVGGHTSAVRTTSPRFAPVSSTISSTFRWNACAGKLSSSSTPSQSSYTLSLASPNTSRSVSAYVRIPVPPVCSQYPGFAGVWPLARPAAMALAAPAWSEASAVSVFLFC